MLPESIRLCVDWVISDVLEANRGSFSCVIDRLVVTDFPSAIVTRYKQLLEPFGLLRRDGVDGGKD